MWDLSSDELLEERLSSSPIPWGAPHVAAAVEEIDARFTGLGNGGTYPGHGEDPPGAGFAADFWTTDKAKHDEVFFWLIKNAVRLGIKYVISWRRIWSVARAAEGIREYTRYDPPPNTASQDHKNHVHVSFNANPPEEDMALSDEDIAKIAAAVWSSVAVDMFKPPPGEATASNQTWKARSEIEWLVENVAAIKKAVLKP